MMLFPAWSFQRAEEKVAQSPTLLNFPADPVPESECAGCWAVLDDVGDRLRQANYSCVFHGPLDNDKRQLYLTKSAL